jgi:hypothetical protein
MVQKLHLYKTALIDSYMEGNNIAYDDNVKIDGKLFNKITNH